MPVHPPVMIMGMHRSGTSCLTGCLEQAGLYLGNVNTEAGFNKKGNRENRDIMTLHDQILKRVGASWDNPPDHLPDWTASEISNLETLLEDYEGKEKWGVKDPRSLFTLKGWKKVTEPKFVGTFRHPKEVADSLVYRAKSWARPMEIDKAYGLWASYNSRLLDIHNDQPFDIIRYDIDLAIYRKKLTMIMENLNLDVGASNDFRDERLHNQQVDEDSVPSNLKSIWEALNDVAI